MVDSWLSTPLSSSGSQIRSSSIPLPSSNPKFVIFPSFLFLSPLFAMFRQASRLLPRSMNPRQSRAFSTEALSQPAVDSVFEDSWKKVVPNQDPPKTPLSFMKPRPPTPASIPSKLTVNFALPYQSELASKELKNEGMI